MVEPKASDTIKLPKETRFELENLGPKITSLKKALETMKALNMDVSMIESQLEMAEKQRVLMLNEFG